MGISTKIEEMIHRSSWIRKMFNEGAQLKAKHGAEKVFDFSLGNPTLPPPAPFMDILAETASTSTARDHAYMPNTGLPQVRKAVADFLAREQGAALTENEVIMTCGAAGALNVILKAILDPGDEVMVPAPYFVEYGFYADNHGGSLKPVPTTPDFDLDFAAIENAVTSKTRAMIINSPNNPTGKVYSEEALLKLGDILRKKSRENGRTIYLLSDEPYRKIAFDGIRIPGVMSCYENSILATSYSKDISIPGERIGFLAVNPDCPFKEKLIEGMALANRILGFINAPAFLQRLVGRMQGSCVDIAEYARKKDILCKGLREIGYEFVEPAGAFYLFPKSPVPDDVEFVRALQEELILTVPGSGFGGPGHFRIAFCVDDSTIVNAMPGFRRVFARFAG